MLQAVSNASECHTLLWRKPFETSRLGGDLVFPAHPTNDPMAEGESEHDGALKRYVSKVQEHREFESRVKKLRETVTWTEDKCLWCW